MNNIEAPTAQMGSQTNTDEQGRNMKCLTLPVFEKDFLEQF